MNEPEHIAKYKARYLHYSLKNILVGTVFILVILSLGDLLMGDFNWNRFYLNIPFSILFGFGQIALQRYWYKKGELHIPTPPKYLDKTYAEIQEEKKSKSKDV